MKKKKALLKIVIVLLLVLAGAIWWLNTVYLPTKVKAFITEALEQTLSRKVTLGDISYHLFKGIVLKDLTIFEKGQTDTEHLNEKGQAKEKFLKVKEVSFTFLLFPLLRKKIKNESLKFLSSG